MYKDSIGINIIFMRAIVARLMPGEGEKEKKCNFFSLSLSLSQLLLNFVSLGCITILDILLVPIDVN